MYGMRAMARGDHHGLRCPGTGSPPARQPNRFTDRIGDETMEGSNDVRMFEFNLKGNGRGAIAALAAATLLGSGATVNAAEGKFLSRAPGQAFSCSSR